MEMVFAPADTLEMSWLAMPAWDAPVHLEAAAPDRRGTVETHEVKSEKLEQPVKLAVYLPRGYAENDELDYPVAYVTGGSSARQQGGLEATLDNLTGESMEPTIVVFVDAAVSPFMMGQLGAVFAEDIVPMIDGAYRTRATSEERAILGSGFSGYGALFTAFSQAGLFGRLGVLSPTMLDSMREPLEAIVPEASEQPIEIYLDWAKYGLRNPHENWDLAKTLRAFDGLLRQHGYEPFGGEAHDGAGWSSWRNRTDDMLITLFPVSGSAE